MTAATSRRIAAAIALGALAAAPSAQATGVRLDVKPDPGAPAGKTAKALFTMLGASVGQRYRIDARQVSGQNPLNSQGYPVICTPTVGRLIYERAGNSRHVFKATPIGSYELGSNAPCRGTYHGELQQRRLNRTPKVLLRFTLLLPSMRLVNVKRPG